MLCWMLSPLPPPTSQGALEEHRAATQGTWVSGLDLGLIFWYIYDRLVNGRRRVALHGASKVHLCWDRALQWQLGDLGSSADSW